MSRLDSFIRRLEAQRACLDRAAAAARGLAGPALELGLGNGRTLDHLRGLLPGRRILVFEREVNAHAASLPAPGDLALGELRDTLPAAARDPALRGAAALAHADLGRGDPAADRALAAFLGPALLPLLRPGAWVVSDQPLGAPGLAEMPPPGGVAPGRYFTYTRT